MGSLLSEQFVDGIILSRHNCSKLEELAQDAIEAQQIMSILWTVLNDRDDVEIPVGLFSLLQISCGNLDTLLCAIQTYQECVFRGSDFDVPF